MKPAVSLITLSTAFATASLTERGLKRLLESGVGRPPTPHRLGVERRFRRIPEAEGTRAKSPAVKIDDHIRVITAVLARNARRRRMMIRSRYDPEADAAYFYLTDGQPFESEDIAPNVTLDFDKQGRVVGMEVLWASNTLAPGIGPSRPARGVKWRRSK